METNVVNIDQVARHEVSSATSGVDEGGSILGNGPIPDGEDSTATARPPSIETPRFEKSHEKEKAAAHRGSDDIGVVFGGARSKNNSNRRDKRNNNHTGSFASPRMLDNIHGDKDQLGMMRSVYRELAGDVVTAQLDHGSNVASQQRVEAYVRGATETNKKIVNKKQEAFIITNLNDIQRKYAETRHLQASVKHATDSMKRMNDMYSRMGLTTDIFAENMDDLEEQFDGLKDDIAATSNSDILTKGVSGYYNCIDTGVNDLTIESCSGKVIDSDTIMYETEYNNVMKNVISSRRHRHQATKNGKV
jgi:hypothetical protein